MSKWELINLDIHDENSLYEALDLLHDAKFNLSESRYETGKIKWEAVFKREYFEGEGAIRQDKQFLFFRHYCFPLAECILSLDGVSDIVVEDKSRIEIYTFNEIKKAMNHYELMFCEDMRIKFSFENSPSGKLQDKKILEEQSGYWTIGQWGWMEKG